eukprot:TRINITY_DN9936_c0_g1_i1.p1 TRINITY_DN9936_c0_g1~~TRINITY_DN9936_c0_g1_i1.p1  ORF type:complete len:946 (-),score=142.53 TRINITY_DN9936_c0_g1_i1:69-2813(-)
MTVCHQASGTCEDRIRSKLRGRYATETPVPEEDQRGDEHSNACEPGSRQAWNRELPSGAPHGDVYTASPSVDSRQSDHGRIIQLERGENKSSDAAVCNPEGMTEAEMIQQAMRESMMSQQQDDVHVHEEQHGALYPAVHGMSTEDDVIVSAEDANDPALMAAMAASLAMTNRADGSAVDSALLSSGPTAWTMQQREDELLQQASRESLHDEGSDPSPNTCSSFDYARVVAPSSPANRAMCGSRMQGGSYEENVEDDHLGPQAIAYDDREPHESNWTASSGEPASLFHKSETEDLSRRDPGNHQGIVQQFGDRDHGLREEAEASAQVDEMRLRQAAQRHRTWEEEKEEERRRRDAEDAAARKQKWADDHQRKIVELEEQLRQQAAARREEGQARGDHTLPLAVNNVVESNVSGQTCCSRGVIQAAELKCGDDTSMFSERVEQISQKEDNHADAAHRSDEPPTSNMGSHASPVITGYVVESPRPAIDTQRCEQEKPSYRVGGKADQGARSGQRDFPVPGGPPRSFGGIASLGCQSKECGNVGFDRDSDRDQNDFVRNVKAKQSARSHDAHSSTFSSNAHHGSIVGVRSGAQPVVRTLPRPVGGVDGYPVAPKTISQISKKDEASTESPCPVHSSVVSSFASEASHAAATLPRSGQPARPLTSSSASVPIRHATPLHSPVIDTMHLLRPESPTLSTSLNVSTSREIPRSNGAFISQTKDRGLLIERHIGGSEKEHSSQLAHFSSSQPSSHLTHHARGFGQIVHQLTPLHGHTLSGKVATSSSLSETSAAKAAPLQCLQQQQHQHQQQQQQPQSQRQWHWQQQHHNHRAQQPLQQQRQQQPKTVETQPQSGCFSHNPPVRRCLASPEQYSRYTNGSQAGKSPYVLESSTITRPRKEAPQNFEPRDVPGTGLSALRPSS